LYLKREKKKMVDEEARKKGGRVVWMWQFLR